MASKKKEQNALKEKKKGEKKKRASALIMNQPWLQKEIRNAMKGVSTTITTTHMHILGLSLWLVAPLIQLFDLAILYHAKYASLFLNP